MAGYIEKLIDSVFDTIKKQQIEAAKKDPEYQKAVSDVDKKANEINSYLDELDKKYGIKSKRYTTPVRENKTKPVEESAAKTSTPSSLWLAFFIAVGFFIYFIATNKLK